jgi:predicted flap endonuclease-1-like 5' DNA nuclease
MAASLDELPKIGAPATRALNDAGYTSLRRLADVPRAELAKLHGMGPKGLRIIEDNLTKQGLRLS